MTNEIRPDSLLDDDDELSDDEATIVIENPLTRSSVMPSMDGSGNAHHLSSFSTPKSSRPPPEGERPGRASLYDRLMQSGALDEVLEIAADAGAEAKVPLTPAAGFVAKSEEKVAELAEELEPGDRPSVEELRDSDLDLLEAGEFEALAKAEAEPFVRPRLPMPKPIPQPQNAMPSILLGPGASTRGDSTERVSRIPSTHPLANSLSPVSAIPAAPSENKKISAWMMGAAAIALLGAGVGIARLRQNASDEPRFASQPSAPAQETIVERLAVAPPAPALEPAPQVDQVPAVTEPVVPAAAAPVDAPKAAEPASAEANANAEAETEEPAAEEPASTSESEKAKKAARRERREVASSETAATKVEEPTAQGVAAPEPTPAVVAKADEEEGDEDLPSQPDREEVVSALTAITPQLAACVGENHGVANVTLTVRGVGVVSHALVSGQYAGTPEGSCIARAVKAAQFKPFSDPSIRVTYPFQL